MPTPSLLLDIVPLALVLCGVIAAGALLMALRRRGPRFLALWAAGGLLIASSVLLIVMRALLPAALSILIANLMLIAGYLCLGLGTRALVGRSAGAMAPLALVAALAFMAAYGAEAGLAARIAIVSGAICVFSLLMLRDFLRPGPLHEQGGAGWRIGAAALAANAAGAFVRLVFSLGLSDESGAPGLMSAIVMAVGVVATVGIAATLVILSLPLVRPPPAARSGPAARETGGGWVLAARDKVLLTPAGTALRLTGSEYLVLRQLCAYPDRPVSRLALNSLIGRRTDNPKDRAIDILISRLRRKCAEAGADLPVTAVRSQGYLFHGAQSDPPEAAL